MTRLDDRTWAEAGKMLTDQSVCVLPCGAMEQHGPHLPLGTDTIIARALAARLAEACGERLPWVCLPTLAYGISPEHLAFSGTLSLSREAFCAVVRSIASSLAEHGVRRLVLLNAHGGNSDALGSILRELREEIGLTVILLDIYRSRALGSATGRQDWHAGRLETSLYMALSSAVVDVPAPEPSFEPRAWSQAEMVKLPWRSDEISPSGIIGDPSGATAELGRHLVEDLIAEMVDGLRSLGSWGEGGWL